MFKKSEELSKRPRQSGAKDADKYTDPQIMFRRLICIQVVVSLLTSVLLTVLSKLLNL